MTTKKILKYLKGSASLDEIRELEEWLLSSRENYNEFNLVKAHYIANTFDETSKKTNVDKGLDKYKKNIAKSSLNKKSKVWHTPLKYAATILCVFGLSYFYFTSNISSETMIPQDAITLKLENGNTVIIEEGRTTKILDPKGNTVGLQNGNQISYQNESALEKIAYNTLTVPYGKRFDVVLSDNTHVYLNAGSSLKYPIKFLKGQTREVYLNGEAFFDVAKDASHPFIVNANDLNIKVLGTKFNVSAYPEETTTNAVLIEGSVSLSQENTHNKKQDILLVPGEMGELDRSNKTITKEIVDTDIYTSWINGNVLLRHTPFKNILKKLERQFNVVIINNNTGLDNVLFTASFDNASLEFILQTFHNNYGINYTIKNNEVTINP